MSPPVASKGATTALKKAPWSKVVRVGEEEYDITGWRHPGGNVINYALANTGADATEVWREFHDRSKRAHGLLKNWPRSKRRPYVLETFADDPKEKQLSANFDVFREELKRDGFFEPVPGHIAWRLTELALIFALGCFFFWQGYSLLGVLTHGMFGCRCGWVQHEGGHCSLTGNINLDKFIQKVTIGFGLGASGPMWNSMHLKHHATPQKEQHDLDLDTTPFVAFFKNAFAVNRARFKLPAIWIRLQAYLFLPVTSGAFIMAFWLLVLHPRKCVRDGDWVQALIMLSSHIVRTCLVKTLSGSSWLFAYGVGFWGSMWVSGVLLFGHFSTSHTFLETVPTDKHKSWVRYAVEHTVDISPQNSAVSWMMGYLNCQVLHHLFPTMPQFKQPEASKRFAVFCKQNDLDYKIMSYPSAWYHTFKNMDNVGKELYEETMELRGAKAQKAA